MADRNIVAASIQDVPLIIPGAEKVGSKEAAAPAKAKDKPPSKWEIDKLKYQEARSQLRHTSYAFYVTMGFFLTITGWFLSFSANRPYLALVVGSVFLFLLLILSKNSRISEDNLKFVKKLERTYRSRPRFKPTGIEGIADFLAYAILSGITAYFLFYPYSFWGNLHGFQLFGTLFIVAAIILLVTYYILGDGKLGKAQLSRTKLGKKLLGLLTKKTKLLQTLSYSISFAALAIYWYLTWF
jgi:hypothetical protein